MIDYLTVNWKKQHLPKAVAIIKLQDGVAAVLAVVLAYVADSCIGRVNGSGSSPFPLKWRGLQLTVEIYSTIIHAQKLDTSFKMCPP